MPIERIIATTIRGVLATLVCCVIGFGIISLLPPDDDSLALGVAVWAASVGVGIWQGRKTWREDWRRCATCLYDLAGCDCTHCPECGTPCASGSRNDAELD